MAEVIVEAPAGAGGIVAVMGEAGLGSGSVVTAFAETAGPVDKGSAARVVPVDSAKGGKGVRVKVGSRVRITI